MKTLHSCWKVYERCDASQGGSRRSDTSHHPHLPVIRSDHLSNLHVRGEETIAFGDLATKVNCLFDA
jgi:hypothetical protein